MARGRGGIAPSLDMWDLGSLLSGSKKGLWYAAWDLPTLFQTATFTTPVALHNDPVGSIRDKSPNGFDCVRNTDDTARALWRTDGAKNWFEFDATNDWYELSGAALAALNNVEAFTIIAGVRFTTSAAVKYVFTFSDGDTIGQNRIAFGANNADTLRTSGRRLDSDANISVDAPAALAIAGQDIVIAAQWDWAEGSVKGWVNKVVHSNKTNFQTPGRTSPTDSLAARFGFQSGTTGLMNGRVYEVIAVVDKVSEADIFRASTKIAKRMGGLVI